MKIKSAISFRKWYKNLTPARKHASQFWDENFIGAQHNDLSGFFTMYHGDKVQVYDFLRKEVEMAEDGQAIYEFVQNAADSNSTKFYMFYDENKLIVINNGSVFSKEGIKSILNIGQSFGKQEPDKIGRYGIGFKLVHRLVGKSSGLDELLNVDKKGHRGPILFSWSEKLQLNDFLKSNEFEYVNLNEDKAPWLLKILITNFPTQPAEKVKDIDYNEIEPFKFEELKEFQSFLNSHIEKIDLNSLDSGTIFFLRLGDNKFDYLERQQHEYLNGLSTSMHFLKSLDTLVINDKTVKKDKEATNILEFTIENGSDEFNGIGLTEIRDKESNAIFKICFADNANSANEIKKHPNIYKYFPAVKEVNNLSFVIHCNLFELSSNRQNLTETPINKNLLRLLSRQVIHRMEIFKSDNRNTFKNLFTSILMSDESSSKSSGNGWQSEYFYKILLQYIQKAIPTKDNRFSNSSQNVKINNLKIQLNLSDFGLSHIQWFEWDNDADRLLIDEAKKAEKLGIKSWDIADIVENANLGNINNWIASCHQKTYESFLKELDERYLRKETKEKICQIKLFKFSNGEFYSFNEIVIKQIILNKLTLTYGYTNVFFKTDKTENIVNELNELGIILSEINISEYPKIFSSIEKIPDEKIMYLYIAENCKINTLKAIEKKKLFLNFINPVTKFDNVTEGILEDLELFCDRNSEIKPLKKLIGDIKTPFFLNTFKIKQDEYFPELKSYLLQEDKLFDKIILPNIEIIKDELTSADDIKALIKLYQDNQKFFFKEFIVEKENNDFVIIKKTRETYQVQSADKETRKFLDENCSDNLFVLPNVFLEFKDEEGIIRADDLHSLILEFVVADQHKEIIVDIVKYNAKHKFLQKLSEFRFNSETEYAKDDYEYKILDLACNVLNEGDYLSFKNKVVIEAGNRDLKLSEIPPFLDKIKIDECEISLAKILPGNYENSDHLNNLLNQFIGLGLNKERIGNLFGISEEPEPSEIFQMFSEQVKVLENGEQLAFVLLYNKFIEEIDLKMFKVFTKVGGEYDLTYSFYINQFNFLVDDASLDDKYNGIKNVLRELPFEISESNQILEWPCFIEQRFVCPDIIPENLTDEQKLSFIDFLFNLWENKNKKNEIKNIVWSKINDIETDAILGFNPTTSVYPSRYACESEVLPDYIMKWLNFDEAKIDFLSALGVWVENSVIVELRKYLGGRSKVFNNNRLAQEIRFKENELNLFNSFVWLKEMEITLKTAEHFEKFKKVVEVINENRANYGVLEYNIDFDFEELKEKATEWKSVDNFSIYLYNGSMPRIAKLNEIQDYIFFSYNSNDFAINENSIFINEKIDAKKTLQKIASEDNNTFTFENLWTLFEEDKKDEYNINSETNTSFLDEVNEFISDLEGSEWNEYVPELKNILELSVSHPKEKQKLFNLIAKIKLTKERNVNFEDSDEGFNAIKIGMEKFFIHSARGAFAYIHPIEILKMKYKGYKMALDFNTKSRIKIYETAEEILQLNKNHILAYQYEKSMEDLFAFCEVNKEANKHLLIIDKNNSSEKSRALLKLLNIEDDYQ